MRGTPCPQGPRGWGDLSAVPEQKLLLLKVLPEPAEELGGLNSRLSSSEKGDSEAGDTFCWGRSTRRGMRLRDTSFSSCVLCSCSARDTPSGTSRMYPPPSIIEAGAGKSRPLRPPPPRAGAGRDFPAPASPARRRPVPARLLTLPLSRRGPIAPQWRRRRQQAPGMGERDALSGAALSGAALSLSLSLRRCPARPRRSPPRHVVPPQRPPAPAAPGRCGMGSAGLGWAVPPGPGRQSPSAPQPPAAPAV